MALCPSVCQSQTGFLLKKPNILSWFLAQKLPSHYPTLSWKELGYLQKLDYFHLELCLKLCTQFFSWSQVPST